MLEFEPISIKSDEDEDIENDMKMSSSSDNPDRHELLWREPIENVVNKIKVSSYQKSQYHSKRKRLYTIMYVIFGLINGIFPVILSNMEHKYLHTSAYRAGLLACSIISVVGSFLNFSSRSKNHDIYENRFHALGNDIEFELVKKKADRQAADVFMERVKLEHQSLCEQAPNL